MSPDDKRESVEFSEMGKKALWDVMVCCDLSLLQTTGDANIQDMDL